jgi:uncharacterized protein (UPF0262 family)
MSDEANSQRLVSITLDDASIGRGSADQEHERLIAIYDLVEQNTFGVPGRQDGPYSLHISIVEKKVALDIRAQDGDSVVVHIVSLMPFRRILKDYFAVCESYYAAIRTATPAQIEAIDMGRRGLHNDGAHLLAERLKGKVECDFDTSRRLFTLLTALHWKG